jgi:predicted ATP-grasp superfamily ATP-dependent carboligase
MEIAERHKIPLPFSIRVNNQSDLEKIPSVLFPCVLKPESPYSWRPEKAYEIGIGGLKAIPVANKSELFKQYNRIKKVDSKLIVQKMIVGPDENHLCYHALIDSDGRTIAEFVGKKLRLTPPHFGMGCYVESIKSDEVTNEGRRILRLLSYKGIAEIDFKRDERDGRLYFFELNPRFGFWMGLDVACGVDFPYYYYKLCLGDKIIPKDGYLLGKTWLSLYYDIKGIRPLLKDGSLTWHQWMLSVIKADVGAIYALDDPFPAISLLFHTFKRLTKRFILKFIGNNLKRNEHD